VAEPRESARPPRERPPGRRPRRAARDARPV